MKRCGGKARRSEPHRPERDHVDAADRRCDRLECARWALTYSLSGSLHISSLIRNFLAPRSSRRLSTMPRNRRERRRCCWLSISMVRRCSRARYRHGRRHARGGRGSGYAATRSRGKGSRPAIKTGETLMGLPVSGRHRSGPPESIRHRSIKIHAGGVALDARLTGNLREFEQWENFSGG